MKLVEDGARLVVTGCLAERHGEELAAELPEIDQVAPFGVSLTAPAPAPVPVALGPTRRAPEFDLLNLPRPRSPRPWAYVKIAEGCDRACGFCAVKTGLPRIAPDPEEPRRVADAVARWVVATPRRSRRRRSSSACCPKTAV